MTTTERSAHHLGPDDFVWDHFSRPRRDDVVARIHAAAAAAYEAIGLYIGAWADVRTDAAAVRAIDEALESTGLVIANIEVVSGWADPAKPSEECVERERLAYEMADHFGCRYMQAIGGYTGSAAQAAAGFAGLCDRAAEHGLLVGLEWVPSMTNIETAAQACGIVLGADRPNGGFCVDSWHLTRSTNDVDDIHRLPGDKVFAVQLNDGPVRPPQDTSAARDYMEDCLANRVPPGEGEFALIEMVQALDAIGSAAPIGLEVCSADLWNGPVEDAATTSAAAMRRVLAEARGGGRLTD